MICIFTNARFLELRAQGLFEVIIDDAKSKLTLLSEKLRVNYVIVGRIVMIISFK